jgi:hypothetical protein
MAVNDYIELDGKRYKVAADLYEPGEDALRTHTIGLTAKTIIQDFSVANRHPQFWKFKLRVFINDPWPDDSFGTWADLRAAYLNNPYVSFVEHDDTQVHDVVIDGPLLKIPQVPANISGLCNGILLVDVELTKVHQ